MVVLPFAAIPCSRNSPAHPKIQSDMLNLAIEYATWSENHCSFMESGGLMFNM